MLLIPYENKCWQTPSIIPYVNLNISPAASALHYGMECFEGMKAYRALSPSSSNNNNNANNDKNNANNNANNNHGDRGVDNTDDDTNDVDDLRLFRPEKNMERLRNSMTRLGMPGTNFDSNEVIECIKELVRLGK
jgi:branched-chain amino acid aminotransferase